MSTMTVDAKSKAIPAIESSPAANGDVSSAPVPTIRLEREASEMSKDSLPPPGHLLTGKQEHCRRMLHPIDQPC